MKKRISFEGDNVALPWLLQKHFSSYRNRYWACFICSIANGILIKEGRLMRMKHLLSKAGWERSLLEIQVDGMTLDEGRMMLRRLGYESQYFSFSEEVEAWDALTLLLQKEKSVIVFPKNHAVTVLDVNDDEVLYVEPDSKQGLTRANLDTFMEYWSNENHKLEMISF